MWKDDPKGVFPDPQSVGMATPNMIAYQRYNALLMLMAGMKDGELANAAPIGGMAAVMIYQPGDPYGRAALQPARAPRHRARQAARAAPRPHVRARRAAPRRRAPRPSRTSSRARVKGRLHDAYRQSWVASPEPEYVAAGNAPLRAARRPTCRRSSTRRVETVDVKGKPVPAGRERPHRRGARAAPVARRSSTRAGQITPTVVTRESLDAPEKLLTPRAAGTRSTAPPKGDVTIEHVQHSFYMAANYGFQILNGNFAAAIDDYELKLRFMNDLATYRIYVSWLWSLAHHEAPITKDGHLLRQALTEDGVVLGAKAEPVKAGTRFDAGPLRQGLGLPRRVDGGLLRRAGPARRRRPASTARKAPVIMELLRRQLLSPRCVQHSARVLFVVGQASAGGARARSSRRSSTSRARRSRGACRRARCPKSALAAHDYALDVTGSA